MTGTAAKKRNRETTQFDVDPDKKLKGGKDEATGNGTRASSTVVNGTVDSLPTTSSKSPTATKKAKNPPPREAFESPAISSSKDEEETPYMTARQDKSKKTSPLKKNTPAKLVNKLEAVREEEESAKKQKAATKPKVKIVYRGSWFCTSLFLCLWIGSSAILGGLYLAEKLNHDMHVFLLQQELLDSPKVEEEAQKAPQELAKLVEELQERNVEAEGKLAGFKREFQKSLARLEKAK